MFTTHLFPSLAHQPVLLFFTETHPALGQSLDSNKVISGAMIFLLTLLTCSEVKPCASRSGLLVSTQLLKACSSLETGGTSPPPPARTAPALGLDFTFLTTSTIFLNELFRNLYIKMESIIFNNSVDSNRHSTESYLATNRIIIVPIL